MVPVVALFPPIWPTAAQGDASIVTEFGDTLLSRSTTMLAGRRRLSSLARSALHEALVPLVDKRRADLLDLKKNYGKCEMGTVTVAQVRLSAGRRLPCLTDGRNRSLEACEVSMVS